MIKPHMAQAIWEASSMRLASSTKKALAENLSRLLESRPGLSRMALSKQMGVADGTLGRIKYGTGNPTVEVLDQIGSFFKVPAWRLIQPAGTEDQQLPSVDVALLTRVLQEVQGLFNKHRRVPSEEQLAAAVAYVYGQAAEGKRLDEASKAVASLLERAGDQTFEINHLGG